MPYVTIRYERAKLYEEVWAEAVTKVAKRYGISDVALRKICKKLAVRLPPLGYWAKLEYEECRRRREAFEERRRKELELVEALEEETHKWRRAGDIRGYVAAVEARLQHEALEPDRDRKIREWIAWSRHKADWIDPIVAAPCPEIDGE